ncbi:MAG: hypothetical protein ACRDG4_11760, partial [Chloroflexota bacterium]
NYAALGVCEYVQFDPTGEMLSPRLQVFRLGHASRYEAVTPEADGSVRCVTLPGYDWLIDGYLLRLRERATGRLVPTAREQAATARARAEAEGERAAMEAARADSAEAELMRLREQVARLQADPDSSR